MSLTGGFFSHPNNFAGIAAPYSNFETARVVILPVPYDSTTEWHSGTREGPKSIIEASFYLEWYDIELDREIYQIGIHTLPELQPSFNSPQDTIERIYETTKLLIEKSKFVVMLGGEHSISVGAVRAYKERFKRCSVLQLDAHADLRDEYLGTKFSHACVMRRIIDICPIIQVGIRSMSLEEKNYISSITTRPFLFESNTNSLPIDNILDLLTDDVYITIDLDVFDPSIMQAVGTPEPGGMQWYEVLSLLKSVSKKKNIIGFDIVELCPSHDTAACSFLAAKLAYKLIGYSFLNH